MATSMIPTEETVLQPRMDNPAMLLPGAYSALQALADSADAGGLPSSLVDLVHIRASQINGCSMCLEMHARAAKSWGESEQRLFAVGAWRDAPFYTGAERAALALTESVTRLSDRTDPVPDDVWEEATRHFDETALAALLMRIVCINAWNRLNVPTRQVAGTVRLPR
jgi:AhpD family alkylhydroperoxidase